MTSIVVRGCCAAGDTVTSAGLPPTVALTEAGSTASASSPRRTRVLVTAVGRRAHVAERGRHRLGGHAAGDRTPATASATTAAAASDRAGEAGRRRTERASHHRAPLRNSVGGQVDPEVGEVLGELGAQPGADELPTEAAGLVAAGREVEGEQVLEGDDVALHADHLGDRGDPAGAVLEAGLLDDQVERAGHLLADGAHGQVDAGHEHHGLEAGRASHAGCWRAPW